MTVKFHPQKGTIVRVDLGHGFRAPEMIKRRPAIVVSDELPDRPNLCTIVPLSTTEPRNIHPHHHVIALDPRLPPPYTDRLMWVKCDMVLTVAFHRLRYLSPGKDPETGQRIYDIRQVSDDDFTKIQRGIKAALSID